MHTAHVTTLLSSFRGTKPHTQKKPSAKTEGFSAFSSSFVIVVEMGIGIGIGIGIAIGIGIGIPFGMRHSVQAVLVFVLGFLFRSMENGFTGTPALVPHQGIANGPSPCHTTTDEFRTPQLDNTEK